MFCCRATSWDSGVGLICYTMLYICCRSYRGQLFWLTPGLCVGKLLPDLDMLRAMSMSFWVCSRVGEYPNLWWVGVILMFLAFLRVTSLCGVSLLISLWGFGVPGECRVLILGSAIVPGECRVLLFG